MQFNDSQNNQTTRYTDSRGVRVHTIILIFRRKWKMKKRKMDTHFPFTVKNEKWTPNFIFHFSSQMENGKWVFIFDFSFCICDEKYKMGNCKNHENDNTYPGPLAQLLLKPFLTVTQPHRIHRGMGMLAPVPLTFKTLG